jgi:hypothetical protein
MAHFMAANIMCCAAYTTGYLCIPENEYSFMNIFICIAEILNLFIDT